MKCTGQPQEFKVQICKEAIETGNAVLLAPL